MSKKANDETGNEETDETLYMERGSDRQDMEKNGKEGKYKTDMEKNGKEEVKNMEQSIEQEYNDSFRQHMLTEKLTQAAIEYVDTMNPASRVLESIKDLDESLRKDCIERLKPQMQEWLGMFEKMLKEGHDLPVDLIGRAADIAKAKRADGKKQ